MKATLKNGAAAAEAVGPSQTRKILPGLLWLLLMAGLTGCSIKQFAVNKVGDALASGGTTFASDEDPELIRQAVPFSLKLMESLLAESPRHKGLLFATASGFTQYAYAFVQQDADELEDQDFAAAEAMRARARRLYLRARDYGLRGLEARHPGIGSALRANPTNAVRVVAKRDVPLLYWTAVSWAAAISLSKDDPQRIAEVPQAEALIDRAAALDPDWDRGSIHSFLITYEMVRQGAAGDAAQRSRRHFERAVELSGGKLAGPYVSFAEAVSVQKQDLAEFDALLARAQAINPDDQPETRLVNLVMQRRARWLLSKRDELFLIPESTPSQ
ncbi:MAG: TRAP transporter TatT component family protein [Verrucomicrobia bacterium]|nr:TRAP transporter TatT component family protein [Verrucomicrobiota bacterium]